MQSIMRQIALYLIRYSRATVKFHTFVVTFSKHLPKAVQRNTISH